MQVTGNVFGAVDGRSTLGPQDAVVMGPPAIAMDGPEVLSLPAHNPAHLPFPTLTPPLQLKWTFNNKA